MTLTPAELLAKLEAAYRAGWARGYDDGGEHDCRMFPPSATRAWNDVLWQHIAKTRGKDAAVAWYKKIALKSS